MKRVFADSWYYIALLNPRDSAHERAKTFAKTWRGYVVTTRWVLAEIADGFATDPGLRALAARFLVHSESHPSLRVIPVSEVQFGHGLALYRSRSDKQWSLTDCISFVVMEQEGLNEVLSGDRHFRQAGFVPLLAER
jgi:predicted nucleic acid-binding protein